MCIRCKWSVFTSHIFVSCPWDSIAVLFVPKDKGWTSRRSRSQTLDSISRLQKICSDYEPETHSNTPPIGPLWIYCYCKIRLLDSSKKLTTRWVVGYLELKRTCEQLSYIYAVCYYNSPTTQRRRKCRRFGSQIMSKKYYWWFNRGRKLMNQN